MLKTSDTHGDRRVTRAIRAIAACAFVLVSAVAHAQTPAGTVISNQATASGQVGASPVLGSSNIVRVTTSAAPITGTSFAATLETPRFITTPAGTVAYARHVLTNTGTATDTYTLGIVDLTGHYVFTALGLYLDANDDGQPDNSTPITAPVSLTPGQVYRFVAAYQVPATAPSRGLDRGLVTVVSVGGISLQNIDEVTVTDRAVADCGLATKVLSHYEGPSPGGPVTVTLRYSACDKARSKVTVGDHLPPGMRYVPGSGRWLEATTVKLTDGVIGDDKQGDGNSLIAYEANAATGVIGATITNLLAGAAGSVMFDVEIEPGVALGTSISNTGSYVFYDAGGNYLGMRTTNTVNYLVTGRVDVELVGQRLPTAIPGTPTLFTNVLTNRGTATETFDITLSGSTFPAATTFALFKGDGATPLPDTDGNGTPDTGPVAPGASYNIVVRVLIPATAPPGAYKVVKTARAASAPMRTASADDAVDTLASKCGLVFEPDNQSTIGRGQHVTYTHYLTNRGNCIEVVTASGEYLTDSQAGWTSAAYLDGKVAGDTSLPGALDPSDVRIARGWTATVQPGESLRILVDVLSPTALIAKQAKVVTQSNLTTFVITSTGSGALTVRDTTIVDDKDEPAQPDNAIRNFTDSSYVVPTLWGVIGGNLWLRADARSCNADSAAVESRTVVITGPNGEREEATATETGANTGIFAVPALPVRPDTVKAGDGVLQGRPNDTFDIEIVGCGRAIATVVTLMEAAGVVFDSRTNQPVAGASVLLVTSNGGQCTRTPANIGGAPNPVVTGDSGRYTFPAMAAGDYCLVVTPPNGYRFPSQVSWTLLPQTRNLSVTGPTRGGSYGSAFQLAAGGLIVIDLPVDGVAQDGLFVQKDASRQYAEVGEFIDYTVRVRNGTGNVLGGADVMLADDLPAGFAYVAGTARRDGKPIADPVGGKGPRLTLALGPLARDAQITVTYRVRLGPGSLQGDGINRVQASYVANGSTTLSNIATAKVIVSGGVFTDKGFILGKVFLDCNANGVQERGELGVGGIRAMLEDGTYIVSDEGGKFSFYGVSNRTHVVKVDRTTLPAGARLAASSSRHLGDGGSRIVDLKSGEMARADFAITPCSDALVNEVKQRADAIAKGDELGTLAGTQLATEARVITDVKALPASGFVSVTGASNGIGPQVVTPLQNGAQFPSPAPGILGPVLQRGDAPVPAPLEALVPTFADNQLAFVGLEDGQTLAYSQTGVRVKGTAGATFKLFINDAEVSAQQVGKRAVLNDKQVQAWEYIGVELKPGRNTLTVSQLDAFGNPRGSKTITVIAPDKLAQIAIEVPSAGGIADGKSAVKVVVTLTDAHGVPVTVRTPVTLEASRGKWQNDDLDAKEPGLQQFIEGGRGEFLLTPPMEPAEGHIVVASGGFKSEARLDFMPELRQMIANGVIEGVVNMRNINTRALTPTRASDGFEQEIRHLSRDWNGGKTEAGVRAALYLKGKIKGEYLLTAAYDSDKDTNERLFRDIQPDEFYPIYGDSAVRGFDAQSTSRLYVRVDNKRSYLLWGDFTTNSASEVRKLTNYSRSLTGIRQHYENERFSVNAFASKDSTRQVIEEIRANGTSGPFQLGTQGALINSEKVEIITRDRNQPALIIGTVPQSRFSDYEIEVLTGRILFKAPVPSVDRDLNPVAIRVTYEVDQGGDEFWVVGVDGQVKVTDRVEVGGIYVKDKNPLLPFTLAGAHLAIKVGEGTYVIGEAARTESGVDDVKGDAGRIEVKHDSVNLKGHAFVAKTDRGFENPGSYLMQGRSEAGGKLDYKLTTDITLKAEALRTEDAVSNAVRDGVALSVHYQIAQRLSVELGLRHAAEKGAVSPYPQVQGAPLPEPMPEEVTTVRARMTAQVPWVEGAAVYGELELDVQDTDRKIVAVGGEYQLKDKGRVYARHEFISSITGPYGLNQQERQNTTAIGVDTEYMKDGRVFSEYRIRDAMSGGDVEAALGLRNLWSIAPGLRLGTTFERVQSIAGTGLNENTALALALEYTGSPVWKGSTRLEIRDAATQQSLLFTVGLAARLSRNWTALARNAYTITRNTGAMSGEHVIDRMQAGLAWRDSEQNRWNVLARVEYRVEEDDTQEAMHLRAATSLVSIHGDWQLSRPFLVTGRYAAKWTHDQSNGLSSRYRAQVVGARGTWEFMRNWDVSMVASALFGDSTASRQYGIGLELGYLVATNLWVSAGYNFTGYKDADLAGADYTARGPYVRVRYKFDEALFDKAGPQGALRGAPAADNKTMKTAGEGAR